jgi:hypothetical protein
LQVVRNGNFRAPDPVSVERILQLIAEQEDGNDELTVNVAEVV